MDKQKLLDILADDEDHLLDVKPKNASAITADERLITAFQEINDFIKQNGREPEANPKDIMEFQLHSRLGNLRTDAAKSQALQAYDELGLLGSVKKITSLTDIFADDDIGLLYDSPADIFILKHVPVFKETNMPDYVAQRKPCPNFENYELLFKQCHAELRAGERKLIKFKREQQIEKGMFFVLKGVLLYVDQVGELEKINGKPNARLHCIFENGTESDILLRSLAAELYKDGRRVTEHEARLLDGFSDVADEDTCSGHIYVLKSLSNNPTIKSINHLHKIGFSSLPVTVRIKNAEKDPTFLTAPVEIVSSYLCYNLNPQKFEHLIHRFFGSVCLDVELYDREQKLYRPREWFIVPFDIIDQVITLLLSGEIVNYRYDEKSQTIVLR